MQFKSVEDFLTELKIIEKFIQEIKRVARGSVYKEWTLAEEFKRKINKVIRRKLIEVEQPLKSINQW